MNSCECRVRLEQESGGESIVVRIGYCSMHAAAPEMAAENERLREVLGKIWYLIISATTPEFDLSGMSNIVEDALAQVENKEGE